MRDKECLAASPGQDGRNRLEPATVAVRLDDGGALRGSSPLFQVAPIRHDGVEIDREYSARFAADVLLAQSGTSGSRSSSARLAKRVTSALNCNCTEPVG